MAQKEQELQRRLARLVELYLTGDVDRARYEQEKRACYDQMANLHSNGYSAIMNAGETLERFETLWSTGTALEKKKLLRCAVAAVLIRGKLAGNSAECLVSGNKSKHFLKGLVTDPLLRDKTVHAGVNQ
jgi:hypothetical protein